MNEAFETVIVGTGFASTFFLVEQLSRAAPDARILVLERGRKPRPGETSSEAALDFESTFVNLTPEKPWLARLGFGGGTCWTGNTPRMHPSDFETQTRYGVGVDWPFGYDELEPYFLEIEKMMGIGGMDHGQFPRSAPYPMPPHRLNAFDRILAEKYPGHVMPMPSARSSASRSGRPNCCANSICDRCPIRAKFQIDQHLAGPYADPRVTLLTGAEVFALDVTNDRVTGVLYRKDGRELRASCDLAILGAHALFNPFIMLRSGLGGPALGKYLNEQWGINVRVNLDGVDSLDGSQIVSGLGTMFLDGDFRRERPGCLVESWNAPWLRAEEGRWRQRSLLRFVFEDVPSEQGYVEVSAEDPERPAVHAAPETDYARAARAHAETMLEGFFDGLPIEDYVVMNTDGTTEAHIQGTTRMGDDPETSVVDANLVHHRVRNLLILGSGVFPTCMAANPTLPLSALALRAARKLTSAVPA